MEQGALGHLQQLILLAVLRLENDAYAREIREEIHDVTGREMSVSTVHVTLVRLERRGLVSSTRAAADGTGGKPKRLFSLTPTGRQVLANEGRALAKMWDGLNPDLA